MVLRGPGGCGDVTLMSEILTSPFLFFLGTSLAGAGAWRSPQAASVRSSTAAPVAGTCRRPWGTRDPATAWATAGLLPSEPPAAAQPRLTSQPDFPGPAPHPGPAQLGPGLRGTAA